MTESRRVVALGGGHGLAVVLRAARRYSDDVTAIVTVADDGGSSGRLRRDLGVLPPGDLRKSLVAMAAPGNVWADAFEYRFPGGDLDGHALGNLVLVGLADRLGGFDAALEEAARLVGATGRVLPATPEPVVLKADVEGRAVEGQVAVQNSHGRIRRVELVPADAAAHPAALDAIARADQIVLAPGSLFTSVLPVLCVPEIGAALGTAPGHIVQIANLGAQVPETEGLDAVDHLRAAREHGARVDTFVYQRRGALPADADEVRALGAQPLPVDVAMPGGTVHDPARLATVLSALLES